MRSSRISAAPSGPISASTSAARFSATRIGVGAEEQDARHRRSGCARKRAASRPVSFTPACRPNPASARERAAARPRGAA